MTGTRGFLHMALVGALALGLAGTLSGALAAAGANDALRKETVPKETAPKETVLVRGGEHDGFGRLVFDWSRAPGYALRREGQDLVIAFEAPAHFDLGPLDHDLEGYLGRAQVVDGGTAVRFPLKVDVQLKHFMIDSKLIVDLIDINKKTESSQVGKLARTAATAATAAAPLTPPAAPSQPAAPGPTVPVRIGEHPGFSRMVFDWPAPVPYAIEKTEGQITVRFGQPGRLDLRRMRVDPPPEVTAAVTRALPEGVAIDLAVAPDAKVRHYASAGQVVVDVLRAGTALDAHAARLGESFEQHATAQPPAVAPPAAPAPARPEPTQPESAQLEPARPETAQQGSAQRESAQAEPGQPQPALTASTPKQPVSRGDRGSASTPINPKRDDANTVAATAGPTLLLPAELAAIEPAAGASADQSEPEPPAAPRTEAAAAPQAAASIALPSETDSANASAPAPAESGSQGTATASVGLSAGTSPGAEAGQAHGETAPSTQEPAALGDPGTAASNSAGSEESDAPTPLQSDAGDAAAARSGGVAGPGGAVPPILDEESAETQVAAIGYDDAFIAANDPPTPVNPEPILGIRAVEQQQVGLRFNWNEPVSAAVFRRGPFMWLVFDREARAPIAETIEKVAPELAPVRRVRHPGATVIRMTVPFGLMPKLVPEGSSWLVHLLRKRDNTTDRLTIETVATIKGLHGHVPIKVIGGVVSFEDPDVGDRLHVVTLPTPDLGLERDRSFPQFRALKSYQGLVVQSLSDGLQLEAVADGIVISSREGLFLSPEADVKTASSSRLVHDQKSRLFDLVAWRRGDIVDYGRNRLELLRAVVEADERTQGLARLDLARFYFAHGLANEALGVLEAISGHHPILSEDPQVILLRGASQVLREAYTEAAKTLDHPALSHEWEAVLWRAALDAARQDWDNAARRFFDAEPLMADYARPIRFRLQLLAAEARLGVADSGAASQYLNSLLRDEPNDVELAQINVFKARQLYQDGLVEDAKALWQEVAESEHGSSRTRSRLALIELGEEDGELSPTEVIEALERLRFSWRGDEFEFSILSRLGDLYAEQGDFRNALLALRQAASHLPGSPRAEAVTDRMREIFAELYVEGGNKALSPVAALALYEEFRELTPVGSGGDILIAGLADRLVEVDLLDEAARLLSRQVKFRLTGEEKARIGARIALLRLLDKRPQEALEALRSSSLDNLAPDLARQRQHLEARALAESGRQSQALALLDGDESDDALRLRADILWEQREWRQVALLLEKLVPADAPDRAALEDDQVDAIVRLAIAYTLDGNRNGLYDLGWRYGSAMAGASQAATFEMLTGDLDAEAIKSVADELVGVETIQAFLSSYKQRIQTGSLSSIN